MVVTHLMSSRIMACGQSDMGLVRQNNEDVWATLPADFFYVLADGMGGHLAGEVAARETVEILCRIVKKKITPVIKGLSLPEIKDLMRRAICHANAVVFRMSRASHDFRGMGTTVCCLLFHEDSLVFAHVGDSRIYRYREKRLTQLTKDHSLLADLVDQGQLDERQASDFHYKNIITKAVGTEPRIEPSVELTDVRVNDLYLMCSDGLSDLVTAQEIETAMSLAMSIEQMAQCLIAMANERGGRDNITVVIAKIEGMDESKDLSR